MQKVMGMGFPRSHISSRAVQVLLLLLCWVFITVEGYVHTRAHACVLVDGSVRVRTWVLVSVNSHNGQESALYHGENAVQMPVQLREQ